MFLRCERGSVLLVLLALACGDSPNATAGSATSSAGTSAAPQPQGPATSAGAYAATSGRSGTTQSASAGSAGSRTGGTAPAAGSGNTPSTGAAGTVAQQGQAGTTAGASAPIAAGSNAGSTPTAGVAASAGTGGSAAPTSGDCDRACLIAVMQSYLDALVAKDPSKLKVASTLKYTENGRESKLGETLWKTASSLMPDTRLDFADPQAGQVASHVVVNENGSTPVIYQTRLKVVNHEITEIETMAVRRQGAANGFFNVERMKPEPVFLQPIDPGKRMTREAMNALTELYLDYLEGKVSGGEVPFDMGCKRYENGQVTASGLSSFERQSWSFNVTRRTLIIDEEAGITWGMYPFTPSATTLVVGEAFKLIDGKIVMIQAVMANQPARAWD